jgi:hypothetical protein
LAKSDTPHTYLFILFFSEKSAPLHLKHNMMCVQLSDFAQVGSRCDECLTDTEIMSGPEKSATTLQSQKNHLLI